jgi:uncharacterized protein YaeQ
MSTETNKTTCPHGHKNTCTRCSMVKLVAYLEDDAKIVWYSFFKEEKKFKSITSIAVQMGTRLEKNYKNRIKKMMFFDNTTGAKEIIAEN